MEKRTITDLTPAGYNPRQISKTQIDKLKKSITEFGFVEPVVINKDNTIIGGHQRVKAAEALGMTEVPVVVIDIPKGKERALNIALNRISGDWDEEKLKELLAELTDEELELTGFEELELTEMLQRAQEVEEDDYEIEPPEEPKSKLGDIYQLGEHRLMVGDSTMMEDVKKLMDGTKADMVFTDPPYALFGNSTGVAGITDDKMTRPFFLAIFKNIQQITKLFGHIYTCCDWHSAFSLQAMAKDANLTEKNLCIWDKGNGGVGAMYQQCYEMVWFHANSPLATKTMGKTKRGERTVNGKPNIWRYNRANNNRVHNAQKPVEMIANAINNSSDINDLVVDLFGGSGSTLIACEQTSRKCYMMELDPIYADVIIDRWEKHSGGEAIKL